MQEPVMNERFSLATLPRAACWLFSVLLVLFVTRHAHAQPPRAINASTQRAEVLLGEWWTEKNEGRILFTRAPDGTFRGSTTCCVSTKADPNDPATDIHNPDPKL